MSTVSIVGDLRGGYIMESLKCDENLGAYGSCVVAMLCLVSQLEGCVVSSARQ
jgi:hypothetical protein